MYTHKQVQLVDSVCGGGGLGEAFLSVSPPADFKLGNPKKAPMPRGGRSIYLYIYIYICKYVCV